jgi:hypothetical protein
MTDTQQLELTLELFETKVAPAIKSEIQIWYEAHKAELDAGTDETDDWSVMIPAIDSKEVVHTSPIFEKHLNMKLKAEMIQKGGYETHEKMADDLIGKFKVEIFGEGK